MRLAPGEQRQQQPARGTRGSCTCGVCGWRAMKLPAMLSGWDADGAGSRVVCAWCRRRGHTTAELLGAPELVGALLVPCPNCNEPIGYACVRANGERRAPHGGRSADYLASLVPDDGDE